MNNPAAFLLLLSGFSALTYQIVWVRLLGLSIGMTSAAVGAVLAAVFLGMSLGSWLSGRIPTRWQGRLWVFAAVEAIVGISALALLPLLLNLDQLLSLLPILGGQLWFRFILVTLLLSIPAAGLGAAYPLISSALIRQQHQLADGLASLYALHTMGAVSGALIAALFLIPWGGLDGTIYCAVAINILIAISAYRLDTGATAEPQATVNHTTSESTSSRVGLLVLVVTGFTAVAAQVGWTKYLAILTESTFFGFSLLLSIFLAGIAAGTSVIKLFLPRIRQPQQFLAGGLLVLALSMFVTRSGLAVIPSIETYIEALQLHHNTTNFLNYASVVVMIFPSAFSFGLLFPLSLSAYCGDIHKLTRRAGQGYAANTLAGLAGAMLAGMWMIPLFGTDVLLLTLGIVVALTSLLLAGGMNKGTARVVAAILATTIILLSPLLPNISFEKMILCMECSQGAYRQGDEPHYLFLKEGKSGVVSVVTYDGTNFLLENNGLQESRISLTRSNKEEVLLAMLPHLFLPEAKTAFVLGYGSGTSTEVLAATELETIRVVELEPAIVDAMRAVMTMDPATVKRIREADVTAIDNLKKGDLRGMDNPKVSLEYNDARNTLLMEPRTYDIIISQPSHPWRAGSAHVFTKEFFQIVHSRLGDKGIFSQWLNLNQIDATTLKAIIRAFYDVFPRGVIFSNKDTADIFMLGSENSLTLDYDVVSSLVMRPEMEHYSWTLGIRRARSLLERYYLMTREEALSLVGDTVANSDLNIISELRVVDVGRGLPPEEDPRLLLQPFAIR